MVNISQKIDCSNGLKAFGNFKTIQWMWGDHDKIKDR